MADQKKARKPRQSGVRMGFQAFCRECGWEGTFWLGLESRRNAWAELRSHKKNAEPLCLKCSKRYKALAAEGGE